jgi:hypothetical protein
MRDLWLTRRRLLFTAGAGVTVLNFKQLAASLP